MTFLCLNKIIDLTIGSLKFDIAKSSELGKCCRGCSIGGLGDLVGNGNSLKWGNSLA